MGFYQGCKWISHNVNGTDSVDEPVIEGKPAREEGKGRRRGRDNEIKGGPPRDPITGNYLPEPAAEGTPHTTLGIKQGTHGPYLQGATFNEKGEFEGRTDVTDHKRRDHPNPHYHPETGPNGAKSRPQPIEKFIWGI